MKALFTTSDQLGSKVIQAADGGPASHCGVMLPCGTVLDSTFKHGVALQSLQEFLQGRELVREIPLHLPNPVKAWEWGLNQKGKGYDYAGLLGIALWRDWQSEKEWYCSELLIALCLQGGWTLAGELKKIGVHTAMELVHAHHYQAHRRYI